MDTESHPARRTLRSIVHGVLEAGDQYFGWVLAVVGDALSGTVSSIRQHARIEALLVVGVAIEDWWDKGWDMDALTGALVTGVRMLVVVVTLALVWNVLAAPYRWHCSEVARFKKKWRDVAQKRAADKRLIRKLTSEELRVTASLQQYADAIMVSVRNEEPTDSLMCEVIAWGPERPSKRTNFPWKVKWVESDSTLLEIPKDTSGTLFVARFAIIQGKGDERSRYELWFCTPGDGKDRLHRTRPFEYNRDVETYDVFVRLLISARGSSHSTQRVLQLRVVADMHDCLKDPREGYRRPQLQAKWADTVSASPTHEGAGS